MFKNISLELIDYQNKDNFPNEVNSLVEFIYEEIDSKVYKNNKELITKSNHVKKLVSTINKRFNLNIQLDSELGVLTPAAIIPFLSDSVLNSKSLNGLDISFFKNLFSGVNIYKHLNSIIKEREELYKKIHNKKGYVDLKNARVGGFAVVTFNSQTGPVNIGRFLNDVKADPVQNTIPNSFVYGGDEWKFASKSAKKEQSGLSPLDLLTERDLQTIPSIMNQLAISLGTDNPLYEVAHKIAMGNPLPLTFTPPPGVPFAAFRDYFCEIMQPIALQKGQFVGNAIEAADRFLDGTFEGTKITFGATKTGGLTDSVITSPSKKTLLISSKGGKGAEASAKNLLDEVQKLEGNPAGQEFLRKYAKEVQLLNDIIESGMHGSPLKLAVDEKLIDEKEADQVRALRNLPKINLDNVGGLSLTAKLKNLAKQRTTKNPESVNLYFHLIAAIAHKVADHVNKTTNFPKAASDILNNGALVQVYTKAKEGKDTWTLDEFQTVYPSKAIKGVFLSAGKNYSSTDIKGNFTFLIDKGTGMPKETESSTSPASPTVPQDTEDFAAAAKDITEPRRNVEKPADIGRKKRK